MVFANIGYLINPWINYHGVGKVKLFNKFMVKGTNKLYSLDEQTEWLLLFCHDCDFLFGRKIMPKHATYVLTFIEKK